MGFAAAQGSGAAAGFCSAQGGPHTGFSPGQGGGIAAPSISYAGSPFTWYDYFTSVNVAAPTNSGGAITSFAVQSGTLPTGVSLNTSTGAITGTPTALKTAANVTIRATGPGGTSDATINIAVLSFPLSLTPHRYFRAGGTLWQDSARTTPATSDADPVGAWDDASGNGGHAVQATAGARPTLKLNIVNGHPVIRLDGTDDSLASTVTADASKTIWLVTQRTVLSGNAALVGHDVNSQLYGEGAGTTYNYFDGSGFASMTGPTSSWHVACLRYTDATTLDIYYDNVLRDTGDPQDDYASSTTFSIGQRGDGGGSFWGGDIAEVVLLPSAATAQQMTDMQTYLAAKYGL